MANSLYAAAPKLKEAFLNQGYTIDVNPTYVSIIYPTKITDEKIVEIVSQAGFRAFVSDIQHVRGYKIFTICPLRLPTKSEINPHDIWDGLF